MIQYEYVGSNEETEMGHYGSEMSDAGMKEDGDRQTLARAARENRNLIVREDSDRRAFEYEDRVREVHNVLSETEALLGLLRQKLSPVLNEMRPVPAKEKMDADPDKPSQSELLNSLDQLKAHGRIVQRNVESILHELQL